MIGEVAGVVLAGGTSSRMGRDKALVRPFGDSSPHMLEHTYGLLSALLPRCWVSCAKGRPYEGYPCLFDDVGEKGPAGGILTALRHAAREGYAALLALSCDLPFMDMATLRQLLAARQKGAALATMYVSATEGLRQPLVAIYETAATPLFEAALASGERGLSGILPREKLFLLPYSAAETRPFFNMNTRDDMAVASTWHGKFKDRGA